MNLRKLYVKYYKKISLKFWNGVFEKEDILPTDKYDMCLGCGGGLLEYTIIPNGKIKACGFLPNECYLGHINDLRDII